MSIIRGPKPESNWYLLDKKISQDRRLSWQSRGLLIYLLGKPDHWKVSVEALRKETQNSVKPTSRDGIYSILKELESAGYVSRAPGRDENGRMAGFEYMVSEQPLPDKPLTAEPLTAEQALASNDSKQEMIESNVREPQAAHKGKEIPFEKIRKIYQEVCGSFMRPAVKMTSERQTNIRACWNHSENGVKVFQSAGFWKTYFEHCLLNNHWRNGTETWKASLEFLTRKSTMEPTVEELMLKLGVSYEST